MKGTTGSLRMARSEAVRAIFATVAALLALAAALLASGCGSGDAGAADHPDYHAALHGAPRPLAALYRDGDALLDGGAAAYRERLRALRGHPIVVNDWASWCGPCREELPLLGRAAARFGRRVAFLGVDAQDNRAAARTFLRERPVPYPSFFDPDGSISASQGAISGYPRTAFYDASGRLVHLKQGPYTSMTEITADVHRYGGG
jgi:cytochrome c biogenesis protein CcmG, thiol:disulfide interchange protein DsbE